MPDPWPTILARLLATPGDVVLTQIAQLWPHRHVPIAREMLRTWVRVHRMQEAAHG